MKLYKNAILPKNFQANGVACGIKKSGKLDLALFYSASPAKAACLFTSNKIQAAPIQINKRYLKENRYFRAIIVNSGNANCFTGEQGLKDAEETALALARVLEVKKNNILIASTGIIGRRLPLEKIKGTLPGLVRGLSAKGISRAKVAIKTTDTFTKEVSAKFSLKGTTVTICGVAKGAGMIAPDMTSLKQSRKATMLCFIFTDANITQGALDKALKAAVDNSFNCITVDGCMSTNDTVILLANGSAKNNLIDTNKNFNLFCRALSRVSLELAKLIIRDAEGASKFIQIKVIKAKNAMQAKRAALSIANSNLFKAAVYGENPNFGRIVAAIGASGIEVAEKDIEIKVSSLHKRDINVFVSLKSGKSCATVYTSDLTEDYVKINARYN